MNTSTPSTTFQQIIHSGKPVLVDFFATWCGPCRMMPPILDEVKERLAERITILKIDVDKNPAVAAAYQIQGVPTLMIFKDGRIVWRHSGVIPAVQLCEQLTRWL